MEPIKRFFRNMRRNRPSDGTLVRPSRRRLSRALGMIVTAIITTVVVIVLFAGALVWLLLANKDAVVNFILSHLTAPTTIETITTNEDGTEERVIERTTIFTEEQFVVDTVKKANPAVVSVVLTKEVPTYEAYYDRNTAPLVPGFEFFRDFFSTPQYRQNGTEIQEVGAGSGFLVSADGYIVTNKHVVNQNDVEYTVFLNDGRKYPATVVAKDEVLDVAILKITGAPFPHLTLGDSDVIQVGQSAIAIGNALSEFQNTVSVGVISGLSRSVVASDSFGNSEQLDKVIQTDAAINPGNSGGPLLDLRGTVIGVNVAVARGSENIGFALPINIVKPIVDSVRTTGKIERPFLGIRYVQVTEELQRQNNLPVDYGVVVLAGEAGNPGVIPGSPADRAGLLENDIILSIDGANITAERSFLSIIREKEIGQRLRLRVWRKGLELTLYATLEAAKE